MNTPSPGRPFCYRCHKPAVVCVCDFIQPVQNQTHVQILQHPAERHHPIGTARLATLGLTNTTLKIAYPNDEGRCIVPMSSTPGLGLLYPSKDAIELASLSPEKFPKALIVLDATWFLAHKLYKENKWLKDIPHYTLTPAAPSRYRIRMEPAAHCISTLEAIIEALRIIEPQTDFSPLLDSFDRMIDAQVRYVDAKCGQPRQRKPRKRERRQIPKAIAKQFENMVVVYGENIRLDNYQRVLVSLCAKRLGDGETFERFIAVPPSAVSKKDDLLPSGILPMLENGGASEDAVKTAWASFLKPSDILCAWNKGTLAALFQFTGKPSNPYLFLKAAFGNTVKEKFGTLEEVILNLQLETCETPFTGRANERMGNAIAVAEYLQAYKQN